MIETERGEDEEADNDNDYVNLVTDATISQMEEDAAKAAAAAAAAAAKAAAAAAAAASNPSFFRRLVRRLWKQKVATVVAEAEAEAEVVTGATVVT
jgi:type VI protein secretion system component VasK